MLKSIKLNSLDIPNPFPLYNNVFRLLQAAYLSLTLSDLETYSGIKEQKLTIANLEK